MQNYDGSKEEGSPTRIVRRAISQRKNAITNWVATHGRGIFLTRCGGRVFATLIVPLLVDAARSRPIVVEQKDLIKMLIGKWRGLIPSREKLRRQRSASRRRWSLTYSALVCSPEPSVARVTAITTFWGRKGRKNCIPRDAFFRILGRTEPSFNPPSSSPFTRPARPYPSSSLISAAHRRYCFPVPSFSRRRFPHPALENFFISFAATVYLLYDAMTGNDMPDIFACTIRWVIWLYRVFSIHARFWKMREQNLKIFTFRVAHDGKVISFFANVTFAHITNITSWHNFLPKILNKINT